MYNLKSYNGSFKGIIGEYMFKLTSKNAVLIRFFGKQKYFTIFGKYLTHAQQEFLKENWYSIDAIEISHGKPILYEVKTKNRYKMPLHFKPKMTPATHDIYIAAKSLGFIVKIALVELIENWDYEVTILDFDIRYYCIDKPKVYDNKLRNSKLFKINKV